MPKLSEAYNDQNDGTRSRKLSGFVLLATGILAGFIGLVIGTTAILQVTFDASVHTSQLYAGILTGSGVLLALGGLLMSIPDKSDIEQKYGRIGILLCSLSLVVFYIQFPENWDMYELSTIALITFLYASGITLLFSITFHAVMNFRLKSKEQFTVTHRYDGEGEQDDDSTNSESNQSGGIGVIGGLPNEARETYGDRNPYNDD